MEGDDAFEDDGPLFSWLPPDDRLWRHPSEVHGQVPAPVPGLPDAALPGPVAGARPQGVITGSSRHPSRTWTVAMIAGVIGALAASGIGVVTGAFARDTTVVSAFLPNDPVVSLAPEPGNPINWSTVDNEVSPSIVSIVVSTASGEVSGSGFLFIGAPAAAYIITSGSLMSSAGQIAVTFPTGLTVHARLVGNDPVSGLALLSVPNNKNNNKNLVFPALGSVASLQLADPVLAVGARTAAGVPSVFPGTVSADDQEVDLTGGSAMLGLIGVSGTAPMPTATSGGPLLDQQGQIVGVTISVEPADTADQQLSFAVPIDVAESVAQQMLAHEKLAHPWIGVTNSVDLAEAVAHELGVSGGAQVGTVWPGSPAARVGIAANDVITSFSGQSVHSAGALTRLLADTAPNEHAEIAFLHKGKSVLTTIRIVEQPTASNS